MPASALTSLQDSDLTPDEYGLIRLGGMRLGLVETHRLVQRRDNPRAMAPAEYEALKRSVARFGFKSFIVAEDMGAGQFGVIDGHHRRQVLLEGGAKRMPVVLLDSGIEKAFADLAMLAFNVTGDPIESKYIDLLSEISASLGPDDTAAFVALDPEFLRDLNTQMEETLQDLENASAAEAETGAWQGKALKIVVPDTPEVRQLLKDVGDALNEVVVGTAVIKALTQWRDSNKPKTEETPDAEEVHGEGDLQDAPG